MNVSSLPSEFGIGCFSRDAEIFVDMAVDMGFKWWQVLPITTIGWGNSPYSGLSTHAGNSLYICPNELYKQGLISRDELSGFKYGGQPYKVDYAFARENSERALRLAFSRLSDDIKRDIEAFFKEEAWWLDDYALFMALAKTRGVDWRGWEDGLKFRDKSALKRARESLRDEIDFYIYEQYEFYREWKSLKKHANERGLSVIGDLPFYVSTDSVDVWANTKSFRLDGELNAAAVAGVPPDAFSKDGQVWGNCLYDFHEMKKDGYDWWRKRISHCSKLYDALRLDHFRAFYNYFAIPSEDKNTSVNGKWERGPGAELIEMIKNDNPDMLFIAEDLGLIDDDCRKFIDSTGFLTMRVFQFGFDGTASIHLPYRYESGNVAYTGTHDNNTTLGWLYELNSEARDFALKYCGFQGAGWGAGGPLCESTKTIIKTVMASAAALAVIPVQDLLGYGADTRMNTPGTAQGNWEYRLPYELMTTIDRDYFLDLINTYGRSGSISV